MSKPDGCAAEKPVVRRQTKQKQAVRDALEASGAFESASSLHAALEQSGSRVGIATVYRALATMAEDGEVDSMQSPEGETVYRLCETDGHHHHLVCTECGTTVELEADEVERWADAVATRHGFRQQRHVIDISGVCAACAGV